MFSSVRARYQSILEELLETNSIGDAASGDFTARHSSGSYFCRYRSCPRAVQGFSSSHLRYEHENSHTSYLRCTDSRCGLFGRALKSRAALNRHIQKYHDGDGLAAIPTCLRRTSALLQQDRPRFLLQEPSAASRERDDDVMGDNNMAIDPVSQIHNMGPSTNEDHRRHVGAAFSSSWSMAELNSVPALIRRHGTNYRNRASVWESVRGIEFVAD